MAEEKKEKKPKSKTRKIIEWILTGLFAIIFAFVAVGTVDGMIHKKQYYGQSIRLGWGSFIVQTDSMKDQYPVGSAILTYRDSAESVYKKYQEGKTDIDITFFDIERVSGVKPTYPDFAGVEGEPTPPTQNPMTHRLREIQYHPEVEVGKGRYVFIVSGTNDQGNLSLKGQYQTFTEKHYLGVVKVKSTVLGGFFQFIGSVWGLLVLLLVPACYLIVTSVLDIFKAYNDVDEEAPAAIGADGSSEQVDIDGLSAADRERLKQELLQEMLDKKAAERAKKDKKEEK